MVFQHDKLLAKGLDASALQRVKVPACLDIGTVTPLETALSILAQIVKFRRTATPDPS